MSPDKAIAEAVAQYNQTIADISGRLGNAAIHVATQQETIEEQKQQIEALSKEVERLKPFDTAKADAP